MSAILVQGYHSLKGELKILGSTIAALPMMAAALLHKGTTVLRHVPRIQDVYCMMGILESMGCVCDLRDHVLTIDAGEVTDIRIPKEGGKAMRSSIVLLGALLGRCREAFVHYPGGCSIGSRPIDMHLEALSRLGAEIREEEGVLHALAPRLEGNHIHLPFPSVGATDNVLLAAAAARGTTVLTGAAREPEVEELCRMLEAMGAGIRGLGTSRLEIRGTDNPGSVVRDVPGDRIVTGTCLSAVMACGGEAVLRRSSPGHLECVIGTMKKMGARIKVREDVLEIRMSGRPKAVSVETGPYPGFPTDLQSVFMVLMALSEGTGYLKETVFEARFATAKELHKMGAAIIIEGDEACITGRPGLRGAQVQARDLRGGAALAVAGLAAEGETRITDCHHIFRGYEDLCGDLQSLGAVIRREE